MVKPTPRYLTQAAIRPLPIRGGLDRDSLDLLAMRAAAAARCHAHDPAVGRRLLNRLPASTSSSLPTWPTPGSRSRLGEDITTSFGYTAPYATPPSIHRLRPTGCGPPVAYGSPRPQPVAEVSTMWYRLVSNRASIPNSARRSVLPPYRKQPMLDRPDHKA